MLINVFKEAFMRHKIFSVIRTLLISFIINLIFLCIIAFMMWKLSLSDTQTKNILYVSYFISCLFGGFCFGHIFAQKRIIWGLCFGIGYFLLLLIMFFIFSQTKLSALAFIVLALCCLGGIAGAFLS